MPNKENNALWKRHKYKNVREQILNILGRFCTSCKFNDIRALHIDHKLGNGSTQRKLHGGSTNSKILVEL